MWVSQVRLAADAYLVCLHHALTTEKEEVMGLLVGKFSEGQEVMCDIHSAVTLRRSDKRKDRVEISPEMLIEAQQRAEQMSASSGQELHIVGWYHSHPHITVWPSDIDLQTQAGYQQMDSHFIGLIFSVYNEDKKSKIGSYQVTCFQATNQSPEGESPQYVRLPVPLEITPTSSLAINNQQEAVKFWEKVDRELRVSALGRVASFLDRGGKLLLYKAQIRPYLEYAALSWMSCAASHTRRLDSIQRRALRLVDAADPSDPPAQFEPVSPLDSLEHRRDVAALVVFHKAQTLPRPCLKKRPMELTTLKAYPDERAYPADSAVGGQILPGMPVNVVHTAESMNGRACPTMPALDNLCSTLYEEQSEFLQLSREQAGPHLLTHLHNVAVMVRSVCRLSSLVLGPLVSNVEEQLHHHHTTTGHLEQEATYLKKLLAENDVDVPAL
ncbi:Lys-63-specific deubiquitinase BRCC36 [Chionoecetes opilio]|uniref:Lys-63-specific deubiquitinase BRCC36 n=1 Tax=Chionoecetes opilio TaxID=41210 RepID=A0A8J4YN66_CHIOP|nr:Lys-63-specific deubiquitinase BRCC36 [Chionoecetes opilio]